MTTVQRSLGNGAAVGGDDDRRSTSEPGPAPQRRVHRTVRQWLADHPAWPLTAYLIGYPVWWILGTGTYMTIILAFPMAYRMYKWRVRDHRRLRLPPGFSFWLLFLIITLISAATLTLTAPETIQSPVSQRAIAFLARFLNYAGVTIFLLYAGNLTERELSRLRLAWMLGVLGMYAVFLGFGGVIFKHLTFTSPVGALLPGSLKTSTLGQSIMHPAFAQHLAAGQGSARPQAPFDYTDTWGYAIGLLLPWIVVHWWTYGTRKQRRIAVLALLVVLAPLLKAQDRGAFLALAAAIIYIAVRLARRGRPAILGGLLACVAVGVFAVAFTPAGSYLLNPSVASGSSDSIRGSQLNISIQDAVASPLIGYGDTRRMVGSPSSIAVGPNANCKTCGQYEIGSNGQLWLVTICTGILGAVLFFGFFGYGIVRYWRDTSPYGIAAVLVLVLTFVYMFVYDAVGAPLAITMLAYAMLWRNDRERQLAAATPAEDQSMGPGSGGAAVGGGSRILAIARMRA